MTGAAVDCHYSALGLGSPTFHSLPVHISHGTLRTKYEHVVTFVRELQAPTRQTD